MASPIISQTVARVPGLDWVLSAFRPPICSNRGAAYPTTTEGSIAWSPVAQDVFDKLKQAMIITSGLSLPDFSVPFVVETDALGFGMGVVLMQRSHPIAYFSKQFCPKLLRSPTYIRELHAITTAVKRWLQYLLGHAFVILTDHKRLRELMTQLVQTLEQHVYLAKLFGYNYTIQYKARHNNVVADALSRLHELGQTT